ncbi:type II toxin-antitoxin system Phd/YefM family antitoxin [Lyngbya sp. CCY1209]|jgi:antitoxin (DNA-binding transcriptional repressor) of toxin-antitoxin stability system|uniref:type II toxin-antitoxin system Phd/YefM family antitoxin n=1 Tax=Lyngbya sp. CCY1209 TaxID=2886103 RepID=UPI002D1FE745|nr:type II toxin-antitoxin system Phd/YefM family antitoxin [Lyngbya sp. CCY1209]MEB3885943.1 type II toxin-antitoxin system Phd/YefM family antitoxin [Lyngbya sp. CCY1209]
MISLNIDDIQKNWSGFIKLIEEGNTLIITQADRPIAEIKPISTSTPQKKRRPIGLCEGEFIVPDDFNDPLPEEIIDLFDNP